MHNSFVRFLQLFFILFDLFVLNIIYLLTEGFFDDNALSQYSIRCNCLGRPLEAAAQNAG